MKKKLRDAMEELEEVFDMKTDLLDYVLENGFHVAGYLKQKALLSIDAWYTEEVQKLENLLRKERALAKRCVPELEAA